MKVRVGCVFAEGPVLLLRRGQLSSAPYLTFKAVSAEREAQRSALHASELAP